MKIFNIFSFIKKRENYLPSDEFASLQLWRVLSPFLIEFLGDEVLDDLIVLAISTHFCHIGWSSAQFSKKLLPPILSELFVGTHVFIPCLVSA